MAFDSSNRQTSCRIVFDYQVNIPMVFKLLAILWCEQKSNRSLWCLVILKYEIWNASSDPGERKRRSTKQRNERHDLLNDIRVSTSLWGLSRVPTKAHPIHRAANGRLNTNEYPSRLSNRDTTLHAAQDVQELRHTRQTKSTTCSWGSPPES